MQTNWTSSESLCGERHQYRDRHCWLDREKLALHLQEFLVSPHDDQEEVLHQVCPVEDLHGRQDLQNYLQLWFGERVLAEILAISRALLAAK